MEAPPNFGAVYTSNFRDVFRSLAESRDVTFVPFLLEGVAGVPDLNQGDGIHPNEAGGGPRRRASVAVAGTASAGDSGRPGDRPLSPIIELRGVSKTVRSGDRALTILHPLDLSVPAGQSLSIVGPSGSGKSTLLGLIAGLDTPSTGRILIGGTDITTLDEDQLARLRGDRIGFVFQFFHLIPSLSALENVMVPLEIAGVANPTAKARRLLADVGLTDRGHHYPSQLSGGEQQRVAIARALANDPPILLADEPTGNLDSTNGRHVIELLVDINRTRGTTLMLVTHDTELAGCTDVTLAMRDGRTERVAVPAATLEPAGAAAV